MGFDNNLFPYEAIIQSGESQEKITGHAATPGMARKQLQEMLRQRSGDSESIANLTFNGKELPVTESE